MKTLTELIQNYQNGIPDSDSEILKRMEPLVKGYASRYSGSVVKTKI